MCMNVVKRCQNRGLFSLNRQLDGNPKRRIGSVLQFDFMIFDQTSEVSDLSRCKCLAGMFEAFDHASVR